MASTVVIAPSWPCVGGEVIAKFSESPIGSDDPDSVIVPMGYLATGKPEVDTAGMEEITK